MTKLRRIHGLLMFAFIVGVLLVFVGHRMLPAEKAIRWFESAERSLRFGSKFSTVVMADERAHTQPLQPIRYSPASGSLRVSPINPRYFTDSTGRAIYLTGSHTWQSLQDSGPSNPPPAFDYDAYLNFLQTNNHNFFRLWRWEQPRWTLETNDDSYWISPMPYQRVGIKPAIDGLPKFDLSLFNQSYFDRLRDRIVKAQERGIYVSIMLFDGWSVANDKPGYKKNNPWKSHPFNSANNVNGINGDPNQDGSGIETQELVLPAVTALQEAYVRKVIDTVNDLDNVLYEISNESDGGSQDWQYHMIKFIKTYEAGKQVQHPVGMTVEFPNGNNTELFASSADWVSPNGDISNPSSTDGRKVILADTDHLVGIGGDRQWVWKSFTRGENPVFMDGYDGAAYGEGGEGFKFTDPTWVSLRKNLGYTLTYANRMNLVAMRSYEDLASTGYCLANPTSKGAEYLVYQPSGGAVTVDLSAASGELSVEWFNPSNGLTLSGITVTGGAYRSFVPPFSGDVVLYIKGVPSQHDSRT